MALFGNMTTEGLEESEDRLGGGGYAAKDSDLYTGEIKAFYAGKSAKGANNMTIILTGGDFGSNEYRETVYFTNVKGENYFLNKDDKTKKVPLPGFNIVDDICLIAGDAPLSETDFEEKVMNVYNPEQKKELPTKVQMATGLLGKTISVGILKTKENQTEKQGDQYVPKADGSTREVNHIDKVFHTETQATVAEIREHQKKLATDPNAQLEPRFWGSWVERNKGRVVDKVAKDNAPPSRSGGAAPQAGAGSTGSAKTSLFGNKK
jgi:hypothetical protein